MILNAVLAKIFGTSHEREVKRLRPKVDSINALGSAMEVLDDEALVAKTVELRQHLAEGKTLDDILPEAFAVCREAADRRLGMLNILNPDYAFDFAKLSPASRSLAEEARRKLQIGTPPRTENAPAEGEPPPAPPVPHHTLLFPA
jgi:preprotein translocase subunit SecA